MRLFSLATVLFLLLFPVLKADAGQYLPALQSSDGVCEEIGMRSSAPANCLLNMVNYKGRTCYKCRGQDRCNPACSGGKICAKGKCLCPPNSGLVDCNGMCVKSFQCRGLASGRKGTK